MTVSLRPYQQRAKDDVRKLIAGGCKRALVVAPTGAGKTVLFTSIVQSAVARGTRCLVLSHRRELVTQPYCKFVRAGLDPSQIGVILAGVPAGPAKPIMGPLDDIDNSTIWARLARRRPDAMVQVGSIDSIRNKAKPPAGLLIIDEAHRVLAASYLKLADEYPGAVVIGMTATPLRSDSKPLGAFFQEMVIVATYRDLVRDGFLIEPRVFTVPAVELPDLTRVRLKGGDYDAEALGVECDKSGLVGSITEHWLRHGNNAPTIAFAVNVEHSKHIAERFREIGVPAQHVDASTPMAERDAAFAALRSGAIKVLANVDVATEGLDIPIVSTIILARPTKSVRIFLQQIGRGSRPCAGKAPFVVLDHCGSVIEHGLPHMIEFLPEILHSTKNKSSLSAAPARQCPSCWACLPASCTVCPECGHSFQSAETKGTPEEQDGELVEVVAPSEDDLRSAWASLCSECISKGYKPSWVWVRWGEMYPSTRPPNGCVPPSADACSANRSKRVTLLDEYLAKAVEKGYSTGWAKSSFKQRDGQWPSLELFKQTDTAEWVGGLAVAMGEWSRRAERRTQEPAQAPKPKAERTVKRTVPANDVELVDYAV